jgi:hypothetical protein
VAFLERALQLQPNLNEASEMLSTAYVRMGKFADAIPKLQKAARLTITAIFIISCTRLSKAR